MGDMEKTLDGKLDEKFKQILAKLDTRKETGSNNNCHGGWSRGNNGRGRGNYRGNVSRVRGHSYNRGYQSRRQNRGGYYSNNSGKPPHTCKGLCGWPIRDQFYSRPTYYV